MLCGASWHRITYLTRHKRRRGFFLFSHVAVRHRSGKYARPRIHINIPGVGIISTITHRFGVPMSFLVVRAMKAKAAVNVWRRYIC